MPADCETRFSPLRKKAQAAIATPEREDNVSIQKALLAWCEDPDNANCDAHQEEARRLIFALDLGSAALSMADLATPPAARPKKKPKRRKKNK